MASSSSSPSHIKIKSSPIDSDVLWKHPKHVSEHVWNREEDRKLHIRRVVPTYQGEEEISEQIFSFLRQFGFYWIMKMGYLKINDSLISALIERWRPETHTFHMRFRECTITLQDVSVLLGLRVDGLPLIGPTNLNWTDLCEELLGVRPQEGEIKGSVVKLSWLAHHFAQINNHDDEEQVRSNKVSLRYLQFLRDFQDCSTYAWGPAVLAFLYTEMCSATDYKTKSIGGMCILLQMWAWERCPTLASKRTPSQVENKALGTGGCDVETNISAMMILCGSLTQQELYHYCLLFVYSEVSRVIEWHQPDRVLRQFGMQQPIPESPSQPLNIHGITLKGKHDENWGQLFAPMIDQWNNRHAFRVDAYPRQEGLLSFNLDYMVWYRQKTKMFVDPQNANTATLTEVAETLQYMVSPQGRNTRAVDDLVPYVEKITILSEEQERITAPGIDRRREAVEAEEYSQQMAERGHGMYYTPQTFAQYPTQMYQYPFQGHHTDTSASQHSFGGVAETQAHFSWPTITPSQQYHGPIPTPNAPFGIQWNVPRPIPNMSDLLGVDLRHEFSAEASGRPFARIVVGSGISVHASSEGGIAASFPRGHHCAEYAFKMCSFV
ncbi:Serine/threonine-protein phosphatase 7 long form [Glycine soja]